MKKLKRLISEAVTERDMYQQLYDRYDAADKSIPLPSGEPFNGRIAITRDLINSGLKDHVDDWGEDDDRWEWSEMLDTVFHYSPDRVPQLFKWVIHGVK